MFQIELCDEYSTARVNHIPHLDLATHMRVDPEGIDPI